MANKLRYPELVPILTADDMLKDSYCDDDGRMCLVGRFFSVFEFVQPSTGTVCNQKFEVEVERPQNLRQKQFEDFVLHHRYASAGSSVARVNDKISGAKSAQIWNEFVASQGYTEISLEAVG